ncbi:hypothetical protein SDC9_132379 [bioreactor metagenome]|uniref:Uncharacterized protein n=1 Tax=bioreactor metagenome TaxID=1076179 RepID=A0A645D7R6_9ZZZZ
MYALNNQGCGPKYSQNHPTASGVYVYYPAALMLDNATSSGVNFLCPSQNNSVAPGLSKVSHELLNQSTSAFDVTQYVSYGINRFLSNVPGDGKYGVSCYMDKIAQPSKAILFVECYCGAVPDRGYYISYEGRHTGYFGTPYAVHGTMINVGFPDGHAETANGKAGSDRTAYTDTYNPAKLGLTDAYTFYFDR